MSSDADVLQAAEAYLREQVAPRAAQIDADPESLREALIGLCERNLMALRRPAEYGGPGLAEGSFRHFQEQVARYSGALAFLQTQHQSAASLIAKSKNEQLKSEYLPKMGSGVRLLGIGFSQLRRMGPPLVTAHPVAGGYVLNGHVPWVTGYGFYHEFLIGATLPGGEALFGVVPFDNVDTQAEDELEAFVEGLPVMAPESRSWIGSGEVTDAPHTALPGSIRVSAPMRLAAMESAMTVTVDLSNWFLTDRLVCFQQSAEWIRNNDMINVVLQGHFALGCARGSLDVLKAAADKKDQPFMHEAYAKLDQELERCREATKNPGEAEQAAAADTGARLAIRAWAIDLAVRCAHAAVTASSGAANSLSHPAQRLYREALVYTVSAQTTAIMEATLARLTR